MKAKFLNKTPLTLADGSMPVKGLPFIPQSKKALFKYQYPAAPFAETIHNGFFTVNREWTVTYWNGAAEELLGVKAENIIGKNLWEEFAAIIPLDFYMVYQNAFLQDIPVHFEEYWAEMGAWFDVITYHYKDSLSISFKSCNHAQSTSAAQQLKTLNELYKFVTEITNDCLWEWNLEKKEIFWIDGGHKRVFGYPVENALVPQHFWESCIHPDDQERVLAGLNKIISHGKECIWRDDYRFKKADGTYAFVQDQAYLIYTGSKATRMIGATQDITERKMLENKLAAERLQKQHEITEAVMKAQENEREIIGRELNENINQVLSVAKMYIQMAQKDRTNKQLRLKDASLLLQEAIENIRKISNRLAVPDNHFIGLFGSIRNLITDLEQAHPIKIKFLSKDITETVLESKMELDLFRIVQEQTNNIILHAGATKVSIILTKENNKIILLITDNGKGADISNEIKGVGLKNISSRVELVNGISEITSAPGKGFELKIVLPLASPSLA